jgi:polysaccharide biosynthesis/export protein
MTTMSPSPPAFADQRDGERTSMRRNGFERLTAVLPLMLAVVSGCSQSSGAYVWVDQAQVPQLAAGTYTIGPGDVLSVQVWNQDRMSSRTRVRADGKVSLPLIGDLAVSGRTVEQTARTIEQRLEETNLVVGPRVTVLLEESHPLSVGVLGTVIRPGMYTLESGAGVAEALASAGGLTEFARKDNIFVVRRLPTTQRIRFTFDDIAQARGRAPTFRLQSGDVVVVE